jgi:predicted metal-dependent HD superfamily phosphohydrolase
MEQFPRWHERLVQMMDGDERRKYHRVAHVHALLELITAHRAVVHDVAALTFAAWFHDAVYDPTSPHGNNEERSAALWHAFFRENESSLLSSLESDVDVMIMATKEHRVPPSLASGPLRCDVEFFLDADVSILGSPDARVYDSYARAIRAEFAHVPDVAFIAGRSAVLRSLVSGSGPVFRTAAFANLEATARHNVERELAWLAVGHATPPAP